jgi:hypothetical protein
MATPARPWLRGFRPAMNQVPLPKRGPNRHLPFPNSSTRTWVHACTHHSRPSRFSIVHQGLAMFIAPPQRRNNHIPIAPVGSAGFITGRMHPRRLLMSKWGIPSVPAGQVVGWASMWAPWSPSDRGARSQLGRHVEVEFALTYILRAYESHQFQRYCTRCNNFPVAFDL